VFELLTQAGNRSQLERSKPAVTGREVVVSAPWIPGRSFQQTAPDGSPTIIQRRQQTKSVLLHVNVIT